METLPGTNIQAADLSPQSANSVFNILFQGGGLVLSQVANLIGIELYSVQNWVRRGFVAPPVAKKYTRRQVARLILINMLRDSMTIGDITGILSYINGDLADESDDIIGDDVLYLYFLDVIGKMKGKEEEMLEETVSEVIREYREPEAGASERLRNVLQIMYITHRAAQLKQQADSMWKSIQQLQKE